MTHCGAQLDALQRAEVERLAGQHGLAVASDVSGFGASLDTLRTDEGHIDPGRRGRTRGRPSSRTDRASGAEGR